MDNILLLNCLESVLGKGKKSSSGNYAFNCPFCNHHKPKLEVKLQTNLKGENPYHCWVCNVKGLKLPTLFKKLKSPREKILELRSILGVSPKEDLKVEHTEVQLPKDFKHLIADTSLEARRAKAYLKKRGITGYDIIRYRMGYCETGNYSGRIIVPSYEDVGKLNYFIARSYHDGGMKYKNPPVSKNIIVFDDQINWNQPIILCEGIFDAIAIRRNAIPMLGKFIPKKLETKLLEKQVKQVYILLDDDAKSEALILEQKLKSHGIQVSQVSVNGGDAADLGFEKTWEFINNSKATTFKDFIQNRLQNT